jgi:hypothetical protein
MDVQGFTDGRFGLVRQCFAEILAGQPGTGAAFASLLSPEMLAEAVTPQCAGPDQVFDDDTAWGLGPAPGQAGRRLPVRRAAR